MGESEAMCPTYFANRPLQSGPFQPSPLGQRWQARNRTRRRASQEMNHSPNGRKLASQQNYRKESSSSQTVNYQRVIHQLRRSLLIFQDISDLDKGKDMGCLKIRYTLKWPSYRVPQAANKLKWLVALIIATDLECLHVSHFLPCALWTLPKNSFFVGSLGMPPSPKIQTCKLDFFGAF